MMRRRGVKIAIICAIIAVLLIGGGLIIYFSFFNKTVYHVTGVDKTDYTVADFKANSELEFYKNGTFRIRIEHKDKGLSLTGIGTYTLDGKTYQLTFIQAFGRDTNDQVVNIIDQCDKITCTRSGNRIKFTDHKTQTFYFG